MKFFKFLLRGAWGTVVLSAFIGLVAGVSGIALLRLIRKSIHGREPLGEDSTVYVFIALCAVMLISRALAQFIMTRFTQTTVSKLLRHLCRQIIRVPLRTTEQVGQFRLQRILTKDVQTIGKAMNVIPILSVKITLVVCGLGYFAYSAPNLFACLAAFAAGGGFLYWVVSRRARRLNRQTRNDQTTLTRHVRQMIRGLKELKLHRQRQDSFLEKGIEASDGSLRRRNLRGAKIYALTSSFGRLLSLVVIGFFLFYWPQHVEKIDPRDMFIFGFIILITMRLSSSIVAGFSLLFGKARQATKRLERLGVTLGEFAEEGSLVAGEALNPNWERIELVGVVHSYRDTLGVIEDDDEEADENDDPNADPTENTAAGGGGGAQAEAEAEAAKTAPRGGEDNNFVLGPLDLTIKRGEIMFVVGGNGSGKSTLLKLLSGLYYAEAGEIRLDGQTIDVSRREAYRQLFTGCFDDVVLFDNLWGIEPTQVDERARQYLQALHLDREVTIEEGKFSTTETLSMGQRKRLALVAAYLEERPVYVFDEWAANQDPYFKRVFYQNILPDLKARGRTIVAVTHDDNYFDCADRIVVVRDGKIVDGTWQEHLAQRGRGIEDTGALLNGRGEPTLAASNDGGQAH